jgi:integrase
VQLQALDAGHLNRLYADLLASGRKYGVEGGLSPRTVRYTHTIVHHVLKDAVKWSRLTRNVADAADPPSPKSAKSQKMKTWTSQKLAHFLEVTRSQRIWPAWFFLATTGCRRQEAVGLRWSDVNLETGKASIHQVVTIVNDQEARLKPTPRTSSSRRQIELDERTVAVLRTWKAKQAQERLAFGAGYADLNLVFTRPDALSSTRSG